MNIVGRVVSVVILVSSIVSLAHARDLTFEERVQAQKAIERVYYAHQTGATRSFEEAVPRSLLESKVRTYLDQSAALEKYWHTPVTAEMLTRELGRMASQSRMPERLRELYEALGNDAFVIQECLARPILVDRLARNFYAFDETVHGAARRSAETLRGDLAAHRIDPLAGHPSRTIADLVRVDSSAKGSIESPSSPSSRTELSPADFERWQASLPDRAGAVGPVVEGRDSFTVRVVLDKKDGELRVASYTIPKRDWRDWWAQSAGALDASGVRAVASVTSTIPQPKAADAVSSCPPDDTWAPLIEAPIERSEAVSVWTGTEMIVWGGALDGFGTGGYTQSGGRYDPATDTWTATSLIGAPMGRYGHSAVWTGTEMIVWGGSWAASPGDYNPLDTGGRYNPATDTWTSTSTVGAPLARLKHTAVWTGSKMIVWGGTQNDATFLGTGSRYDPATDSWSATTSVGAPTARGQHSAVWTGTRMIVWGGAEGGLSYANTGGRYDPVADTWLATSLGPTGRFNHRAVWSGSVMIVWGGFVSGGETNTGSRYNPTTDSWAPMSLTNAPSDRQSFTAVWTGSQMLVWGGTGSASGAEIGGRYTPSTDSWKAIPATLVVARTGQTAVWTGTQLIVWGGTLGGNETNLGGRYVPGAAIWTPTSIGGAPAGRSSHTSVWTGTRMIVWGGSDSISFFNSGGRYDPATASWSPTSTVGAPAAVTSPTSVWTGDRMIVWGGYTGTAFVNTGGRYDPASDTWAATATAGAPAARNAHTAVWTGSVMVVWGGQPAGIGGTGGRYNPATNTWAATTTTGAPTERASHSAIWTGSRMIVWGGSGGVGPTGGQYDPVGNTWTSTSTVGAPSERLAHGAVWTGTEMVVWGGALGLTRLDTGGRYDPSTDTWTGATSISGAPSARSGHTQSWTGSEVVVFGGFDSFSTGTSTGGRYDPATDTWIGPTSTLNGPGARKFHTAVWTGDNLIVWGGGGWDNSGGSYFPGPSLDADGDGYPACAGDCNDANAAEHPGGTEICDGLDNDCSGVADDGIAPPSGTLSLAASKSGTDAAISWAPIAGADSYDAVEGSLTLLATTAGDFQTATSVCIADNVVATSATSTSTPSPGDGVWVLVRGSNCGGAGSYNESTGNQQGSRDAEIASSGNACP